jgi:VIT1/CCC1 family predicted Fe2+/Mn2+ transporter
MQRAQTRDATPIHFRSQATRILPGHGTGLSAQAVNDDDFHEQPSSLQSVFSVLANVLGGALLLASMFVLPHVLAGFLV